MMDFLTTSYEHLFKAALALTVLSLSVYLLRRRWEDRRAKKKLAEAVKLDLNVPMSLHPVIDPDVCIGSGSCISACCGAQKLHRRLKRHAVPPTVGLAATGRSHNDGGDRQGSGCQRSG